MKVNSKEEYEYIKSHIKTKPQDKVVTKQENNIKKIEEDHKNKK